MTPAILYRRLVHALDRNTVAELVGKAVRKPFDRTPPPPPASVPTGPHPFDLACRVDTGGFQSGETLAPGAYHTDYYGISPSTLIQALDHLSAGAGEAGIDWSKFTFVDLGSGKGRALFVAARYPFQRMVGVELSAELCEIARANVQTFSAPWQQCRHFDIVNGDAATFVFPEMPLVVFLYHPFLPPVLRKVLYNLWRSTERIPREVYLLYANPTYEKELAKFVTFKMQWHYTFPLSKEDAAACALSIVNERFALYHQPGVDWTDGSPFV